jgi:retinol dehydrogenase-12
VVRQLALELGRSSGEGRSSVICNCVNPGWCKTELFRKNDGGLSGRIGLKMVWQER